MLTLSQLESLFYTKEEIDGMIGEAVVDDTKTSTTTAYSSEKVQDFMDETNEEIGKLNDSLVDIENALGECVKVYHKGDTWETSMFQWFAGRISGGTISVTIPMHVGNDVTSAVISCPKLQLISNTAENEKNVTSANVLVRDGGHGMIRIDFVVDTPPTTPLIGVGFKSGTTIRFS